MHQEFRCQNPACGVLIEGKNRMRDDPETGGLAVICPTCKAKHVPVEEFGLPGGPREIRFKLLPGSGGGGTSDGGG